MEAFGRAEERGHPEAAACIGGLLQDAGDIAGAEAAYRRADAQGSVFGAYNLGILLQQRGDMEGAEIAWRHADELRRRDRRDVGRRRGSR